MVRDPVLDGIAATNALVQGCNEEEQHRHTVALACRNYQGIPQAVRREKNMSDWFLPSTGQWMLAYKGCGYQVGGEKFVPPANTQQNLILRDGLNLESEYFTSTAMTLDDTEYIWVLRVTLNDFSEEYFYELTSQVRPMIAF